MPAGWEKVAPETASAPPTKPGGQTGAIGDRHRNIARENRQHKPEGRSSDILQEGGKRSDRTKIREVFLVERARIEQKGKRNQDASADDEWQHMGNAVHQLLVNGTPRALVYAVLLREASGTAVNGSLAGKDLLDQFLRLVDSGRKPGL